MLRLTRWMADYYLCPWGQVLEAVVPAGVRHQAGTRDVTLLSVAPEVAARIGELKLSAKQAEVLQHSGGEPAAAHGEAAGGAGGVHGRADQRAAEEGADRRERRAAEHGRAARSAGAARERRTS